METPISNCGNSSKPSHNEYIVCGAFGFKLIKPLLRSAKAGDHGSQNITSFTKWRGSTYLTYCGWKKSCSTLDGWNPISNGINHQLVQDFSSIHSIIWTKPKKSVGLGGPKFGPGHGCCKTPVGRWATPHFWDRICKKIKHHPPENPGQPWVSLQIVVP